MFWNLPGRRKLASDLLLAFCLTALAGTAPGAECAADGETAVMDTLNRLYAAAQTSDESGLRAVLAEDFYTLEDGARMNTEDVVGLVRTAHATGSGSAWTISGPEVHVLCDSAWATFHTRRAFREGSESSNGDWAESAVLNYHQGAWQVRFLHSTATAAAHARPKAATHKNHKRRPAAPSKRDPA